MLNRCPECSYKTFDVRELEKHLEVSHFLSWQEYVETGYLGYDSPVCYKCSSPRYSLTPLLPHTWSLPCWDCISKKTDQKEAIGQIYRSIMEYQELIISDPDLQLFLINPELHSFLLPHGFLEFKKVLDIILPRRTGSDLYRFYWVPGFPHEFSVRNKDGIGVKRIDTGSKYIIDLPDLCDFDIRHHYRYSILNNKAERKQKRLKLSSGDCIKFWPVSRILRLRERGNEVNFLDLDPFEQYKIKAKIFTRPEILDRIFEIYNEVLKYTTDLVDSVFLRNSLYLGPEKNGRIYFSWQPQNNSNFINISIL